MGSLKPGATYIYEKADGITYAREVGASPSDRFEIGRDCGRKELDDHNEWVQIRLAAKKNPALQKAVDHVKFIYNMVKNDGQK
jgi:hypothetical protein